jgi:hypothetical protein
MIMRSRLSLALLGMGLLAGASAAAATFQAHASTTAAGSPDSRAVAVAHWLGMASVPRSAWTLATDLAGPRYQSHVPGVGLVELDATTQEVDEVIFDSQLTGSTAHRISEASATAAAEAFARQHFTGFDGLVERSDTYVDHGAFQEYRTTWQARQGEAWLPTAVTVGINSDTGRAAYYWSRRVPLTLTSTTAQVTAAAAKAAAIAVVHTAGAVASEPNLEVVLTGAGQRLVWVTEVRGARSAGVQMPLYEVAWTDAQSGSTNIVAKG